MFYLLSSSLTKQISRPSTPSPTSTTTFESTPKHPPIPAEIEPQFILGGGAGEAEISIPPSTDSLKTEVGPPEASGDGMDHRTRSKPTSAPKKPTQPRGISSSRRLNLRYFCFKAQSSDASLASHLLMERKQRRVKREDEDDLRFEKGKRRPRASGDSCFCMLNYANRWCLARNDVLWPKKDMKTWLMSFKGEEVFWTKFKMAPRRLQRRMRGRRRARRGFGSSRGSRRERRRRRRRKEMCRKYAHWL